MFKKILMVAVATLPLIFGASAADAAGLAGFGRGLAKNPTASHIRERAPALAPFAHVKFCKSNPSDCKSRGGEAVVNLTETKRSQLQRVNASVNRSIRAKSDRSGAGGDLWQASTSSGDCEDFALTKRRQLIALGWSPRALRMAVATTSSGEGHAVLVVKTSKGDLVLDNRTSTIKSWRRTDLRWVKIQSGDNPKRWFAL
jgi:predicted transglutaminase-like cysteine proteinase